MPELTDQQRWSYRVLASTMPVLRLLNDLARPATCAEIALILNITPKTAQRYLNNLEFMHFITRLPETRSYYAIVELETLLAADLPLETPQEADAESVAEPAPEEPELLPESPAAPDTTRALLAEAPVLAEEKIFPPGDSVVVVKSLKVNSIKNLTATTAGHRGKIFSHPASGFFGLVGSPLAASIPGGESPANPPPGSDPQESPPPEAPPAAPPPIPEDIRQALVAAGISEPKRSQIARLPHITPAYVRAWSAYLETSGKPRSSGLLVHLLEQGDPLPEYAGKTGPDGEFHLKDCKCKFCTWGRLLCPDCLEYPCQCEFVCEDCGEDPCTCDDLDAAVPAALSGAGTGSDPAENSAECSLKLAQDAHPAAPGLPKPNTRHVPGAQPGSSPGGHPGRSTVPGAVRAGPRPPPRGEPQPGGQLR